MEKVEYYKSDVDCFHRDLLTFYGKMPIGYSEGSITRPMGDNKAALQDVKKDPGIETNLSWEYQKAAVKKQF